MQSLRYFQSSAVTSAPKSGDPRRQHTVSQGILRRFTDPSTRQLELYDLKFEKHYLKFPSQVGFALDFVKHDPVETEQSWPSVEDELPAFYEALENRSLLDSAETIDLAKRIIALHVVRSLTRWAVHEVVIERARDGVVRSLLEKPQILEIAFRRSTGFYSAGPDSIRQQAERGADAAVESLNDHKFWQSRLMANIEELNNFLLPRSIQVLEVCDESNEFLIGDDPAPTLMDGYVGLGPLAGVTYANTTSIALPVSPRFAIALKDEPEWIVATPEIVHFLNRVELSYAQRRVFYNPNSSLRPLAQRASAARGERNPALGPTLISI